jgi:hypothetical protein
MADIATKQQPGLRSVAFAGMAVARAGLTDVVGIDFDAERTCFNRLSRCPMATRRRVALRVPLR